MNFIQVLVGCLEFGFDLKLKKLNSKKEKKNNEPDSLNKPRSTNKLPFNFNQQPHGPNHTEADPWWPSCGNCIIIIKGHP